MKSGPKQLAKAEEAIGIPDIQNSPGVQLRRVNSRSTRKLVMLKLNVYFGPCASWEGKPAKKCEAEEKPDPSRNHCRWTGCMASDPSWHEQGWRGRAGVGCGLQTHSNCRPLKGTQNEQVNHSSYT